MLIMRVRFWYFWFGFFCVFWGGVFLGGVCVLGSFSGWGGGSVVVLVWFFDCCWSEGTGTAECLTLNGYHSAPLSRTVLLLFGIHSCTFCLAIFGTSGCCSDWPGLCISWARCWDSLWELFLTVVLSWEELGWANIWIHLDAKRSLSLKMGSEAKLEGEWCKRDWRCCFSSCCKIQQWFSSDKPY